jgi:filamentous hemagglutinin family protein
MKTSLVSTVADIASAALSESSKVKAARVTADQPQQLKSVTVYWRGRKMVLMQRPQRRLSALLCKMLRRSWQNLFGTLVKTIGAGAMATAALSAYADVPANTLPTGYQLLKDNGSARMWQHHNHMTIKQFSENATFDWQSFSIGSGASVRFIQNDANAIAINRVSGNDPSMIMGSLTANGKIFLINAAGILVGKTGKIDVAGFTASTLNISDADALSGKLNFAANPSKTIGDVKVEAGGTINAKSGGSIYLIGANVENDGIISAPNGQVLLAAGSMVKLVDTSLPGVSIEVSGVDGKVTNLGQIIASAGTIGIGAALVDNSGLIKASSVEKEGGRIFLRAAVHLTTGDGSEIEANGTTGGNIQLYSDGIANIRGNVSALGSAGNGGYIDTSGKAGLSVHYVPKLGAGGEWYIDPYDIEITHGDDAGIILPIINDAIALISGSAVVNDGTINAQLNNGTSVTLTTGPSLVTNNNGGRITLDGGAAINKTGVAAATLTLNAATDIDLNGTISDGSTAANANGLSLALNANTAGNGGNVNVGGSITLGGNLTSHASSFTTSSGSTTNLYGTSNTFDNNFVMNGGTVNVNGGTVFQNVSVNDNSFLNLNAATTVHNNAVVSNGTLNVNATATVHSLALIASSVTKVNLNNAGANLNTDQLSLSAGVIKSNAANTLNVTGSFTQTNGALDVKTANITQTTGDLQIGVGGIKADNLTLQAVNGAITQAGAITGAGALAANATQGINLTNALNNVANFSASNTLTGQIALSTTGALTLGAVTNSATGASSGDVTISGVAGTLDVKGAVSAVNSVSLTTSGNVTESAGSITANSLSVNAATGINLNGGNNKVNNFAAQNTGSGQILMANNKATELTLGTISNINRSVDISSQGKVTGSGVITAGSLNVVAPGDITLTNTGNAVSAFTASSTGGNITLSTGQGAVTLGAITASSGDLTITDVDNDIHVNGAISANAAGKKVYLDAYTGITEDLTLGSITTTNLKVQGGGDLDLQALANNVGSFSTNGTTSGNIYLNNTGDLVLGSITNTNTSVGVNVTTTGGAITQSAGITAKILNVKADNGITLGNTSNSIGTFIARNVVSGVVSLTNRSNQMLTLNGVSNDNGSITIDTNAGLTAISGDGGGDHIQSSTGAISLTSQGDMILSEGVSSSAGAITLKSSAGDLTVNSEISSSSGAISLTSSAGDLTVNSGISSTSGAISLESSAGNLTVNAGVSTTGGLVSLTSADSLTIGGLGSVSGHDISLTTTSGTDGDINIWGSLQATGEQRNEGAAGNITMSSARGVYEFVDNDNYYYGSIIGQTLNISAVGDIGLRPEGGVYNSVSTFIANSTNGSVELTNSGDLTLAGITATQGAVNIDTSGNMTVNSLGITSGSGISLRTIAQVQEEGFNEGGNGGEGPPQAHADMTINGDLVADSDIGLHSAGAITQTGGKIASANGNVRLRTHGDLTVGGDGITGQYISLRTHSVDGSKGDDDEPIIGSSDILVNGQLTANGSNGIKLHSAGMILQNVTSGTGITTSALNANASTGITLNYSGNNVTGFIANNSDSGNITLATASTSLTLAGNVVNNAEIGNVTIINNGVNNTGGDIIGQATFDHEHNTSTGATASGKVTYTSTNGNVTLSGVTATDLEVNAQHGNVNLAADGVLSVTGTMNVSTSAGITISNSGGCGTTHIANFQASNTGAGNITLVNNDTDGVTNNLISITNTGGDITVDNTGALATGVGQIKASGNLKIATHSPLTIGSGGVTGGSGVTLTAGDGTSAGDVLTLNGAVQATTGAVTFGGNTVFENAAVISLAPPVISSPNQPVQGAGFSQSVPVISSTLPDNSAANNQAANSQAANTASTTTDATTTRTSQANLTDGTDIVTPPTTSGTNSATNTASNQTVGGTDGEFGGSDTSKDDKKDTSGKSGKPLPICS